MVIVEIKISSFDSLLSSSSTNNQNPVISKLEVEWKTSFEATKWKRDSLTINWILAEAVNQPFIYQSTHQTCHQFKVKGFLSSRANLSIFDQSANRFIYINQWRLKVRYEKFSFEYESRIMFSSSSFLSFCFHLASPSVQWNKTWVELGLFCILNCHNKFLLFSSDLYKSEERFLPVNIATSAPLWSARLLFSSLLPPSRWPLVSSFKWIQRNCYHSPRLRAHRTLYCMKTRFSENLQDSVKRFLSCKREMTKEWSIVIEGQFVCPKKDGSFPDARQCDKYYKCTNGVATEMLCDDGLVFNAFRRSANKCESVLNVDCTGRELMRN